MKKMYKAMLLVLCAALLVAGSVLGTLAYLKDSKTVTNTFTVGKVEITLDEAKTNEYGVADTTAARVTANGYKLIPGHTYDKDPVIHLDADSELCYLFVEVVNEIAGIEADTTTIAAQMAANGWVNLSGNIWYYGSVADASVKTEYVVFESFKIADDAEGNNIWTLLTDDTTNNDPKITVTAYAVQKDGFADAQAAWAASGFATNG